MKAKSGLFLMELIIIICFFALASSISVQLFATAHTLSRRSVGIQMAVKNAHNAAEIFKHFGNIGSSGDNIQIRWFDEDWNESEQTGRYKMRLEVDQNTILATLDIVVTDVFAGIELHSLRVKRYLG